MKLRLYLDTRSGSGPYPVRLGISKRGSTAFVTLSCKLLPEQWDATNQCPRRLPLSRWPQGPSISNYISRRRADIEATLLRLEAAGLLVNLSAVQIRDRLLLEEQGENVRTLLPDAFVSFADTHRNPRTRELYLCTLRRIQSLYPRVSSLALEDITPEWLKRLDADMLASGTPSINARNVHLRNIRSVLNWAISEGLTDNYPFRRFKLHAEETAKRSLTLSQLRALVRLPLSGFPAEYRDIFLLSFCLLGINITDLFSLLPSDYDGQRLRYRRAKTGRLYDVRVWPEAATILERYRGHAHLLCIADRYRSSRDYTQHINAGLKRMIPDPPFSLLSTYWARHTWATLAYNNLGASIEDISASLGHQYGSRITAIYINPDTRKVDDLNRRMLEMVFSSD